MATKKATAPQEPKQETVTLEKYNQLLAAAQKLEAANQNLTSKLTAIAHIVNI